MLLYRQIQSLDKTKLRREIKKFLKEDNPHGDRTTELLISKKHATKAIFRTREEMIFCGRDVINHGYSPKVRVSIHVKDGQRISADTNIATLEGSTKEILTRERVILNLIQRMSGISTSVKEHVAKLHNPKIKILDTRKTTPGMRFMEKYAVYIGGGGNHRENLSSGILIKDNHFQTNSSEEIYKIIKTGEPQIPTQIEIDHTTQLTKDLVEIADGFLLDNMTPDQIKQSIEIINKLKNKEKNIFIEVSGGITKKNIQKYNIKGVNGISIGALTHHIKSKDISLDIN